MPSIWKHHAHTNENLRTSFSAPTSFLIGCGQNDDFLGTRNKKAARFFSASFFFLLVVSWKKCCIFFVKLGVLSDLDIDIVTSTWPFWQTSSLRLTMPFSKKEMISPNPGKLKKNQNQSFNDAFNPWPCITVHSLHLHKKSFITTKCHHGKSDGNGAKSPLDVRRECFSWRGSHHLRT